VSSAARRGVVLRPWTPDDTSAVVALWNASIGDRYPLRADVLVQMLQDDPSHRPEDALVAVDDATDAIVGFAYITVLRLPDGELDAFRPTAHLQAVIVDGTRRRAGIGRGLVGSLVDVAARERRPAFDVAGGFFYLWPAMPADLPDAEPFAKALRLTLGGTTFDLAGDLAGLAIDEHAHAALVAADVHLDHAAPSDRAALLGYLEGEFGGEWWHDIRWALDQGLDPRRIVLLRTRDGEIVGHARIHLPLERPVGPPLFWASRLSGRVGGLGPIGVAARLRGRGLGRALLVSALDEVRRAGMERAVIDATSLEGFYGPLGFRPWMTFRHASAPTRTLVDALARHAAR
jgi:predicted N-acetyltransferase YhbS